MAGAATRERTGCVTEQTGGKLHTFLIEERHLVRKVDGTSGEKIQRKQHLLFFKAGGGKIEVQSGKVLFFRLAVDQTGLQAAEIRIV